MKKKLPTDAQACLLAWLWGTAKRLRIDGHDTPSEKALVKAGWVLPTGVLGKSPNGAGYEYHKISDAGFDALEDYLRERRYKRQAAALPEQEDDIIWGR